VSVVLAAAVGFLATRFVLVAGRDLAASPRLTRRNYRDRPVQTASGLFLVLGVVVVEAGRSTLGAFGLGDSPGLNPARPLILFAVLGFGLLGFVDDVLGTDDRGFRGHLRALAAGRLTTGTAKLVGGAAIALIVAAAPGFVTGKRLVADALLVALAANLGNLLDRAPGRTIKAALVAWAPLAVTAGTTAVGVAVAPVMGAAAAVLPDDLRERSMLGDVGANVLGGVLGLAVVLTCGRGVRTGVLAALVAANLAAELVSYSRIIDRVPVLRWLDRLGRAGTAPGGT
jgi:UDP-N-acetylmuramyl pentapeptide phosphotransferase/UDP-N-acetylglucosamine-1-phosphate transferase